MKRRLERRREQLEEKNSLMFGKMERCISISELSVEEQDGCFEELLDELEAVQAKGTSYRVFTGASLEKYCRRLMHRHAADCQPDRWGKSILYVMGMALVAGFLIGLVERFGWKSGSLLSQQISVWLVYGMALTEQAVDHLLRGYIQKSIFRGREWAYTHRNLLEWIVLIICYAVYGSIVYISPLYRIVTSLPRMLCLILAEAAVYGLCKAAVWKQELWMPFLYRIRDYGKQTSGGKVVLAVNLAVVILTAAAAYCVYRYLLGGNVVLCSMLIVVLSFLCCIAANLRELMRRQGRKAE